MGRKTDKTGTDPREPGRKVPFYQSDTGKEDDVDTAGEDSFPASDPPSNSPVSHTGRPRHEAGK